MIQWKSNYTGSTDVKVSGSNPTTSYHRIGKNHALPTESERHQSELSNHDLKIKETDSEDSSNYVLKNANKDLLVSRSLQKQGYTLNSFENDAPKVLVVDDHAASRMTAVALLGMEGYEVIEAESGSTAVHLVAQKQPDLILLDVMMPEMDGFEFIQVLRQNSNWQDIPVIVLTAKALTVSDQQQLEGVARVYQKADLNRQELISELQTMVSTKTVSMPSTTDAVSSPDTVSSASD